MRGVTWLTLGALPGMLNGAPVTWGAFFANNLLPVTLGNIIGGGVIVAGGYWYAYGERA
jgi:formate/nitrite transporter FocA (FNT family)